MATIVTVGVCSLDVVMRVDEPPTFGHKHRTHEAVVIGGGGAATGAVAACRLGGKAMLVARLGCDPFGTLILEELAAEGVDTAHVVRRAELRTSFSSVLIDEWGERQVVNFRDPSIDAPTPIGPLALGAYDVALADTRWPEGAAAVFADAARLGKPRVLDGEAPVRHAEVALGLATHVVFSAAGLRDMTGVDDPADGLARASRELDAFVAVTCGAQGVMSLHDGVVEVTAGYAVTARDTLGAGDVWHGAFALAIGLGWSLVSALRFAIAAVSLMCENLGGRSGAPGRAEVERMLSA